MMPKVKGSHPWALILCNTSDQAAPDWPPLTYFNSLIASSSGAGLYTWWQHVSGGILDFAGSKVFGWYSLSNTLAEVKSMARKDLVGIARAAATAAGDDVSGYLHTLAIVTGYPGSGNVGSDVAYGISATYGQPGWRWCAKCEGIAFWDGSRSPGRCIAGERHDHSGSAYYALPHDTSFPNGQPGWRWCNKCETLIYQTATPASCPGGGNHTLGSSGHYVLRKGAVPRGVNEAQNWCWCNKCQALAYYDGSRQPGLCPVSGGPLSDRHDHSSSGKYSIPYGWAASLGFLAHETGHGFGLDHAFGTSDSGDFYNDTRPGAYGDWTDIMSWANTAAFAQPLFTPAGAGLSAPTLYKLGWLSGTDVAIVINAPPFPPPQSFTLRPLYGDMAGSPPRMISVIEPGQGKVYTAEFRAPLSFDEGIGTARVVIHAMRTLYQAGQDGWRRCSNCEGLIYAGQTACPAGGVHDGSGSTDYWLSHNAGSGAGQSNWRWCTKCCGLFFGGGDTQGTCPAGGAHDGSQSGDYELPSSGTGQSNWQWCNKCQGLAFAGNSTPGVCPAGGLHDHGGSGNYLLYTGSGTNRQNKWRWCNKCQGLYFAGLGACMGGDVHTFGGEDYAPVHDLAGAAGQPGWRYCRKCYAMAFNDGSRPPGDCAAGDAHDHSTSGHYTIPRDAETEASQLQWYWCSKCSALNYVDPERGPGLCSAGGNHSPGSLQYLVARDTSSAISSAIPASWFRWCRKCEVMVAGDNPAWCTKGGNHDTSGSSHYAIHMGPSSRVRQQSYWRTCTKCSALFALNSPDGSKEKPCAAGGSHSPETSFQYLPMYVTPDPFWRWCGKCESMAYWDGSRDPGPCPHGGTHDHGLSGAYIVPTFRLDATEVVNDNLVVGESWYDASYNVRFEVLAINPSNATVRVALPLHD